MARCDRAEPERSQLTIHPGRSPFQSSQAPALDPRKFSDPEFTLDGSARARVALTGLETLWFNTGTLCNLTCRNCYIESSPRNDALVYLSLAEVRDYLDEAKRLGLAPGEIGFTGGEPFMNPDIIAMLESTLAAGCRVLVLTNAMRPMLLRKTALLGLRDRAGGRLTLRVSLDHYTEAVHDAERGSGAWAKATSGLQWLTQHGFVLDIAGRRLAGESEPGARAGYAQLFDRLGLDVPADDPGRLVLFPEMDGAVDVPEITEACWGTLGRSPDSMMCATSRMVVKRKGAARPTVIACTLTPYARDFDLGPTLAGAAAPVRLNHPHCARFCVLGGASCSAA